MSIYSLEYIFLAHITPALATESCFSCVSLTHSHCFVLSCAFPYLLALPDALGLSCIFLAPVLESGISPRSPDSFC